MIGSDLGRLAVFVALPFASSATAIVVLAALAGIGNAFFRPAVLAGLPNLVADERARDRERAAPARRVDDDRARPARRRRDRRRLGPESRLLGERRHLRRSPPLLVRRDPGPAAPERPADRPRALGRAGRGLLASCATRARCSASCRLVDRDARERDRSTSPRSSSPSESYDAGDFGFGLLWAGSGIGLCSAGSRPSCDPERGPRRSPTCRCSRSSRVGIAGAAAAPNVWIGAVAMMLAGFGNGGAVVANITLVQRGAPDRVRGRAFTLLMSVNYAVLGARVRRRRAAHERARRALGLRGRGARRSSSRPSSRWLLTRGIERDPQPARERRMTRARAGRATSSSTASARATTRRARARDLARRERRPGGVRARPRSSTRTRATPTPSASPARRASASRA